MEEDKNLIGNFSKILAVSNLFSISKKKNFLTFSKVPISLINM